MFLLLALNIATFNISRLFIDIEQVNFARFYTDSVSSKVKCFYPNED